MSQSNEPVAHPASPSTTASAPQQQQGERKMERREPQHPAWQRAEETVVRDAEKARTAMERHPSVPVVILGGLAVLAADAVGVGELAMGLAVGYAAYRFFHRSKGPRETSGPGEQARAA